MPKMYLYSKGLPESRKSAAPNTVHAKARVRLMCSITNLEIFKVCNSLHAPTLCCYTVLLMLGKTIVISLFRRAFYSQLSYPQKL